MWEVDHKECLALKNWYFQTVMLEKTLESPLDSKEIKPVNPKGNESWICTGRTDDEAEALIFWPADAELTLWKSPWCWERLKAGEGDDRGWDDFTTSSTWWTQVWVNSGRWWRTGKPGKLQFMGLQRVGCNLETEQQEKQQNISAAAYVKSFWSLEEKMTIYMSHILSFWWLWNILDFPCGSACKESACSAGDLGSIPGLGRSPGGGNGYPLLVILSIHLHNR